MIVSVIVVVDVMVEVIVSVGSMDLVVEDLRKMTEKQRPVISGNSGHSTAKFETPQQRHQLAKAMETFSSKFGWDHVISFSMTW